jgi:flagellar hook-associated protein 2
MATLSSPGIGSGLDINSIVTQLMAIERQPLQQIQSATTRYEAQLSAFGKLQSAVGTLRDAAARLTQASNWTPSTVSSTDPAAVSATSAGLAPPGGYSVSVTRLASAQTLASAASLGSSDESVGSGTLTIELGRWNTGQTAFTPQPGSSAVTIAVASGADSLTVLRDAINAAGAGVTASIVNDATGARLVLRSTATGEENGFRISVADADGNDHDAAGLSRLAFDPASGVSQMTQTLAAANAQATINGIAIESTTNTLENVVDGLTVRLARVTATPVDLTVERDSTAIRKSVTDFAGAYNDLVTLLRAQTSYDDAAKQGGVLQGDRSAVGLLNSLRSLVGGRTGASSVFSRLADIGVEPQRDGTLKVLDGKLDAAVGRLDELKAFFSRDAEGTSDDGFGVLLRSFADGVASSDGMLGTRQAGLRERIQRNADSSARLEDRLVLVEQRLRATYTRLDTNIANLTGLQNYIGQQIAIWNKSS